MAHWINIEEGIYQADEAFLLTPGFKAVTLEHATMEVYLDGAQERHVRGQATVTNVLIVELLEDEDEMDLLVDLGDQFKFLLKAPSIRAAKAFSPDVKSVLQFFAQGPLQRLATRDYLDLRSQLTLIDRGI